MPLLFATSSLAELPPASSHTGVIKRNEHGKLIVVPEPQTTQNGAPLAPTPPQKVQSAPHPPPSTTNPSTRFDTKQSDKAHAPPVRQASINNTPPQCAQVTVTCIEVLSTGSKTQPSVPLTFGQPFKVGDIPKGSRLSARDHTGSLPLQQNEESRHKDGSLRFAVLSTQVDNLKAGEKRVINLFRETSGDATMHTSAAPDPETLDIKLAATIYSPQVTQIIFGNRSGTSPAIPFETGEQVTLQLSNEPDERFTHVITAEQSGGQVATLTKIAEKFRDLINSRSNTFRAYKVGEGGGFERLWITPRSPNSPAFTVNITYNGNAKINTVLQREFQPPKQFEALPQVELKRVLKSRGTPRLNGPVAREYTLVTPFLEIGSAKKHPQLTARLHTRFVENNQRIRIDLVLENNWAYEPDPGNLVYDLIVTKGKQTILRQDAFTHYHHSRWHKVLWTRGEAPQARIRHNMPYFMASKATWNYNLALQIPESVLAEEKANLEKRNLGPMSGAFITPYFPTTGGRPDIGPLPRWTALYLITQDERAEASMFANADAAAGIPIHYRDSPTDQPITLDKHPGLALLYGKSALKDAPPSISNRESPWSPDISHQASFAYIPYLISGDSFYLDEVVFWSAWNLFAIAPDYREREKGLIHAEQMRGQAWALRSLSESAYALPEGHPDQAYYQEKLTDNLRWYVINYPRNTTQGKVSPLGAMEPSDKFGQTAPWQNDFMALVVGLISQRQEPLAKEYFDWLSRFTVNRFNNETNGFCRFRSPGYWIKIRDKSGNPYQTWKEVYKANWPNDPPCDTPKPLDGYPEAAIGYPAVALAMLAVSTDLGIQGAKQTYSWLSGKIPVSLNAMTRDPTWAIKPTFSFGSSTVDQPEAPSTTAKK
jgi:hypothetical protein